MADDCVDEQENIDSDAIEKFEVEEKIKISGLNDS